MASAAFDEAAARAFAGDLKAAEGAFPNLHPDEEAWVRAYVACARGRFDEAELQAAPLVHAADERIRVFASLTLGSALRQRGRYDEAESHDERALRSAVNSSQHAHALIGLAADAVGRADSVGAGVRAREAAAVAPRDDWRVWVRLYWVRAEIALLSARAGEAVAHARRALSRAEAAGARRHIAKSLLFLGAALGAAGDPDARETLVSAARTADASSAAGVAAVAREMLSRLVP